MPHTMTLVILWQKVKGGPQAALRITRRVPWISTAMLAFRQSLSQAMTRRVVRSKRGRVQAKRARGAWRFLPG
jgi:hypothetical protein